MKTPPRQWSPDVWREQQQRWRRFEAWEIRHLGWVPRDYRESLSRMADAWDLASRHNPGWQSTEGAAEHWRHLAEIQRRLVRGRPRP